MNDSENALDLSLLPDCASVARSGQLLLNRSSTRELVAEYGSPLFVYDLSEIRRRFTEAVDEFGPGTAYATKAFASGELMHLAEQTGLSLDVSTDGEYELAVAAGFPPDRLVVHGNNKSDWLLQRAAEDGTQWIVLDSMSDIERLATICRLRDLRARVLVRVNPGIEVHTHEYYATGNRRSKFGIPAWNDEALSALELVASTPYFDLCGLHTHIGSLVYSLENFTRALETLSELISRADPAVFVVGGGLGVRYLNGDLAPTFTEWAKTTKNALRSIGYGGKILAEPGRCLVARSALTIYTVGTVKDVGGDTIVAVDGGMSDNPRPILYDSGYEVALSTENITAPRLWPIRLVGSHCESGDTLIDHGFLQRKPMAGDLLITPVTGAYGYCMASNYNRMRRPAVLFVDGDRKWIGLRRETFEDMRSLDTSLS